MSKFKNQNHNLNPKTDVKYRSYYFSLDIIKFTSELPNEKVYWVISDQLLRSGTSIGANVIEAKSASSKRDFIRFYEIALKSANETKYWICLLRDGTKVGKEKKEEVYKILKEAEEIANMLGSSLLTLKNKRNN
ncbi:MAG: four helix bundle protein [Parcubacteria group bacterium]|jgi:four helix bundle protein|nr:four helix bundle protein [Candidatus Moranbacteria bacterium]MDX9855922.1 four helix bundle protein [Candidatus Moranbacteria bacterium]